MSHRAELAFLLVFAIGAALLWLVLVPGPSPKDCLSMPDAIRDACLQLWSAAP